MSILFVFDFFYNLFSLGTYNTMVIPGLTRSAWILTRKFCWSKSDSSFIRITRRAVHASNADLCLLRWRYMTAHMDQPCSGIRDWDPLLPMLHGMDCVPGQKHTLHCDSWVAVRMGWGGREGIRAGNSHVEGHWWNLWLQWTPDRQVWNFARMFLLEM